jgi:hypothetical protein
MRIADHKKHEAAALAPPSVFKPFMSNWVQNGAAVGDVGAGIGAGVGAGIGTGNDDGAGDGTDEGTGDRARVAEDGVGVGA